MPPPRCVPRRPRSSGSTRSPRTSRRSRRTPPRCPPPSPPPSAAPWSRSRPSATACAARSAAARTTCPPRRPGVPSSWAGRFPGAAGRRTEAQEMFRRTFWFSTGVAAGVWATTKVNRKLKQLTPENLAVTAANKAIDTGTRLKDRAVGFALDVRDNMAQREAELTDALGIREDPELPAPRRVAAIENTTYTTHSYNRNEDH